MNGPGQSCEFKSKIAAALLDIENMLCEKNAAYGNSALEPLRVFSRADSVEQLRVRVDDKLSRLARGGEVAGEDTLLDLIGYLVLLLVAQRQAKPARPSFMDEVVDGMVQRSPKFFVD